MRWRAALPTLRTCLSRLLISTLRTNERGDGTWIVTLQNQNRRPVGTIYIGANKGTVTRTEGMFAGCADGRHCGRSPRGRCRG